MTILRCRNSFRRGDIPLKKKKFFEKKIFFDPPNLGAHDGKRCVKLAI